MRKNILLFGIIAGLIVSAMMIFSVTLCYGKEDFEPSMVLGYTGMIIAFSFIFVGIKNFRDKYNNGIVSFGKAFKIGLFISLIASTFYVLTWLVAYYSFFPDFMEKYSALVMKKAAEKGASAAELQAKATEMNQMKSWYKNPLFVILLTYIEVLPIGIVVAVISSLILKRKPQNHIS